MSIINLISPYVIFCKSSFSDTQTGFFKWLINKPSCFNTVSCALDNGLLNVSIYFANVLNFSSTGLSGHFCDSKIDNRYRLNLKQSVTGFKQSNTNSSALLSGKTHALFQIYFGST